MTLNSTLKAAVPSVVGTILVALAIRYFGNQPGLVEVKEGLKGNAK